MYTIGARAPGHAMLFRKELIARCLPFPQLVTHDFWLGFVAACKERLPILIFHWFITGNIVLMQLGLIHMRNLVVRRPTKARTGRRQKKKRQQSRDRMQLLYEKCPLEKIGQKKF